MLSGMIAWVACSWRCFPYCALIVLAFAGVPKGAAGGSDDEEFLKNRMTRAGARYWRERQFRDFAVSRARCANPAASPERRPMLPRTRRGLSRLPRVGRSSIRKTFRR